MRDGTEAGPDLGALLEAVEAASPVAAVDVLAAELAAMVGATDVSFLIADFSGGALIRFPSVASGAERRDGADGLSTVPLHGSPHDRALRTQRVWVEPEGSGARLFAPVTDRGDALGVLELALPVAPDDDVVRFVASAAHLLALVVITNRRHTDLFERGQRNVLFSLSAEIQRRLLPPAFTCEAEAFTVAGWLEPAADVGGDTFDYSVEHRVLHLSISDAMGHAVDAAQLATLAVGSLRNSRRGHGSVLDQARAANTALTDLAAGEGFVTALLLRVDLVSGAVAAVNAGHPAPCLVRDGVTRRLDLAVDLPFGIDAGSRYREQALHLEPGDRLVLVTDGVLERNASSIDLGTALTEMADLHPRELVHAFAQSVVAATDGVLQDDATVVCVDWYGPEGREGGRDAGSGSSRYRPSEAVVAGDV